MAKKINLEDIKIGMIIEDPVVNNFGQTLLPSGLSLSPNHVKLLKAWKVENITIRDDIDDEFEISDEMRGIAIEYINSKMNWQPRNNYETDLYEMAITNYILTKLKK